MTAWWNSMVPRERLLIAIAGWLVSVGYSLAIHACPGSVGAR